jgi:hypothetical protein
VGPGLPLRFCVAKLRARKLADLSDWMPALLVCLPALSDWMPALSGSEVSPSDTVHRKAPASKHASLRSMFGPNGSDMNYLIGSWGEGREGGREGDSCAVPVQQSDVAYLQSECTTEYAMYLSNAGTYGTHRRTAPTAWLHGLVSCRKVKRSLLSSFGSKLCRILVLRSVSRNFAHGMEHARLDPMRMGRRRR